MKLLAGCMTMAAVRPRAGLSCKAPQMRGRSICKPDCVSLRAPLCTSSPTRRGAGKVIPGGA